MNQDWYKCYHLAGVFSAYKKPAVLYLLHGKLPIFKILLPISYKDLLFPLPLANLLLPAHKAVNFLNYPVVNLSGSLKTYQFTTSLHGGIVIPPLYVKKLAFGSIYPLKTSLKFNTNYLEVLLLLISLLLYLYICI